MNSSFHSIKPHRRYNPLKDEWVLVSPQRTSRPWKGKIEAAQKENRPAYDPNCYLCPGNKRAGGYINPKFEDTFVFDNDFSPIIQNRPSINRISNLIAYEAVDGKCKVVCFSPKHNLTLAQMTEEKIENVINTWIREIKMLGKIYQWAQIFENKGEMMGCSNPHPHCQIWASNFLPNEIFKENQQQKIYFEKHKSPLLVDYLREELEKKERIVVENEDWIIIVPFWAFWPYEVLLMPKSHITEFTALNDKEITRLAQIMKKLLVAYDKLFGISMPYSMGWHFAPFNKNDKNHWQLHAHYYPPLLRSATVKKFMVGYEMLAEVQRDITSEQAAEKLRSLIVIDHLYLE